MRHHGPGVRAALTDAYDRPAARVYVLEVTIGDIVYVTERRYRELAALNALLQRLRPNLCDGLPAFPRKTQWRVWLGLKKEAPDFLENRRRDLAAWVPAVMEQAPDVAVKELLWRGANWSEVPRAPSIAEPISPLWSRTALQRKQELINDRISDRTTQAGSFSSKSSLTQWD
jgi:hypothetical protein